MYFSNRGLASPSPLPRGTTLHLSNRADAPPDRNQPWTKSVYRNGAELGGFPPFQLRIPSRPPMQSKSRFLYTSLASGRTLKIPRLERGGLRTPPFEVIKPGIFTTVRPRYRRRCGPGPAGEASSVTGPMPPATARPQAQCQRPAVPAHIPRFPTSTTSAIQSVQQSRHRAATNSPPESPSQTPNQSPFRLETTPDYILQCSSDSLTARPL